jgi:hypothetical protein
MDDFILGIDGKEKAAVPDRGLIFAGLTLV